LQRLRGPNDSLTLTVLETKVGRLGGLICWENYMPLARYALYSQGVEIYFAPTYDSGDGWMESLRHIAREAGCWVVGSGNLLRGRDLHVDVPGANEIYPDADEWVNPGDSVVIAPGGELVAGPMHQEQGVMYAEVDAKKVGIARRTLDIVGHYPRLPDPSEPPSRLTRSLHFLQNQRAIISDLAATIEQARVDENVPDEEVSQLTIFVVASLADPAATALLWLLALLTHGMAATGPSTEAAMASALPSPKASRIFIRASIMVPMPIVMQWRGT